MRMDGLILVTGGAGFIGSHLVDALLTAGYDVRVLDDFSTGKQENLHGAEALAAAHGGHFQLIAGDVRSEFKMRDAVDGCAAVCHLAAVASVTQSLADPVGTGSVTHGGTVNAVRMAVDAGRSALRARVELRGVRRRGAAAGRRDLRAAAAEPLRGGEARGGRDVRGRRRRRADGGRLPALLQRLRSAPGSRLRVFRRDQPLHGGRGRGRAGDRVRRRTPDAATSCTWATRSRPS